MPRYITNCCQPCSSDDYCKDNIRFFSILALKLKDMAIAINDRMEEIKNKVCETVSGGIYFASVDVPSMTIGVKYEYIEYITRYGPPEDGIFDATKLSIIRNELGITESNYTI
jgi:hypothetical protein